MSMFNVSDLEIEHINELRELTQPQVDVILYLTHKMATRGRPPSTNASNVLRIPSGQRRRPGR